MASRDQISNEQIAKLRRIFEREIQDIRDAAKITELQRLIEVQDSNGIIRLLGINRTAFSNLEQAITDAFRTGGVFTADMLSPIPVPDVGDVLFKFDINEQAAVNWIQDNAATLVVEIVEDQQKMIRETLSYTTNEGINPRRAALDLVGRIDTASGQRKGGYVGLTTRQAKSVQRAREQLESLDYDYFNRDLRDKRFDSVVRRAIEEDKPLTQKQIDSAITSLQNRTLKHRGDTIARTEAINALRAGEEMSIAQAVELGEVDPQDVTKEWDASGDSRVRIDHVLLEGQVVGIDQPFTVPPGGQHAGQQLNFPGDTSLGATGGMTISCRCRTIYRIDFIGRAVREFKGFR